MLHKLLDYEGGVTGSTVERPAAFAQLELDLVDRIQWRYEVIRPRVLFGDRTAQQRAHETSTHPDTVRTLRRRFQQHGMLGLLPANIEILIRERAGRTPEAVRREIDRLKTLYDGFHYRELARILSGTFGVPFDDRTVKKLWQQSPVSCQERLGWWNYHTHPDRYQARLEVIKLSYRGWDKVSIHRFLRVSRPTVNAWLRRFEAEHLAGLADGRRAPKAPARKIWLSLMVQVYHLQKAHPDAGEFRIWSLLGRSDVSVRTIGRVMAVNRLVYDDIPPVRRQGVKPAPGPHPYKARYRHPYWFIDGRRMDFAIDGVHWWSLIILEGYSRTLLAGMIAPTEATGVALRVLYTACLRYGAPAYLVSDSAGAYTSADFEAVCTRLQIPHKRIVSTQGESDQSWMETHFNVQRRLYDYQVSLARTPAELEPRHQAFIQTYNTIAHQGLLKDHRFPAIPVEILGTARGRVYTPEALARHFAQAVVPRTTNRYGCVTLHSYHFHVEEGLPRTQVLLWVCGEQLRAVVENVVLAEYRCRYDGREHRVQDIREGVFYPTRFASRQGRLIPVTPEDSMVVYRAKPLKRRVSRVSSPLQLLLLEVVATG